MGLLDLASANSFWRGYEYYEAGNVISCEKMNDNQYTGKVSGSSNNTYVVSLDLKHPKKSICNCPHAEGSRRVCKHKVALYFSIFPDEAEKAIKEAEEWEKEEEKRQEEELKEIEEYVNSLSKKELREELLWRLVNERNYRRW